MSYLGQLLVANPCQDDEFLEHSVIFIYEDSTNTVGVALNKSSERTLGELADYHGLDFEGSDILNIGGQKNPTALIMLHTDEWACTNTMYIANGISISSDHTMLERLCSGDTPRKWKLLLGMCIWPHGQLEKEIEGIKPYSKKKAWLVAPSNEHIIFENHPQKMWNIALELAVSHASESFFKIS
jgi:putative transcriptional regulator